MSMSKEEIKEVLHEVLVAHNSVDPETHRDHHEFISVLVEEAKVKKERLEKIKTQVLGWGIIAALAAIGKAVYHFFIRSV